MKSFVSRLAFVSMVGLACSCAEDVPSRNDGMEDAAVPGPDAGGGSTPDSSAPMTTGPLLPWKQGNTWTYRVTGDGEQSMKVTTVGALEAIGGTGPNAAKMAFKVTTKKGPLDQTISWQAVEGDRVVRYREQSFGARTGQLELEEHWVPHKLHVDSSAARMMAGVTWPEMYSETKAPVGMPPETKSTTDVWKVDGVDQMVTVPAGTFKAIVLTKSGGSTQKTYWYVPGVGKVKETGGQTEELVSFTVIP